MEKNRFSRILQDQCGQLNGFLTAGNSSMTDVLLWALLVLPAWIGKNGAGICMVNVGIFAGTTFAWLFLVKRLRAYRDVSKKEMHHIWDYIYERYQSTVVEESFLVIWFLLTLMLAGAVIWLCSQMVSYVSGAGESIAAACILVFLTLIQLILQGKRKAIVRTFFYSILFVMWIVFIILVFVSYDPRELLDVYGKIHLSGGTSSYLNILYCNGEQIEIIDLISMLGMGLGCMGLPFLFEGAFAAKDVRELDCGRILSILYSGGTIVSVSMWSLLNIACIFPKRIQAENRTDELIDCFMRALIQKNGWPDGIRHVALIFYFTAALCIAEQMMSMAASAVRGMLRFEKNIKINHRRNLMIAGIYVGIMCVLFVIVISLNVHLERFILAVWNYALAVAAPCMIAVLCRTASKSGVFAGLISGLLGCSFWYFIPVIDGDTPENATGLSAGVAAFVFGLAVTIVVSMFTHKANEEEKKLFEQMKLEQR